MRKKLIYVFTICLALGIQVLSVNADDGSTAKSPGSAVSGGGITFVGEEPEEKEEEKKSTEEPQEIQPDETEGEQKSTAAKESGVSQSKGGVLPQTGEEADLMFPAAGGVLSILVLLGFKKTDRIF